MTERRPSGHGLDDEAIREGHDFIHKAEQEENERAAQGKRGLPDSAIDAEREFEDMVEGNNQQVCGVSNHGYTPPQQRWPIIDVVKTTWYQGQRNARKTDAG